MAINVEELVQNVTNGRDTSSSTTVTVKSGTAAKSKSESGK